MSKGKERKDTSVAVNEMRRIKLERAAIEVANKTDRITKISDLTNHLIDVYLDDAKKDLIGKK